MFSTTVTVALFNLILKSVHFGEEHHEVKSSRGDGGTGGAHWKEENQEEENEGD